MFPFEFVVRAVRSIRRRLATPAPSRRFIAHCRKVFPSRRPCADRSPQVLLEFNQLRSSHIPYAYLARALCEDADVRMVAYTPKPLPRWWDRLFFAVGSVFGCDCFGIYRAFGVERFLEPLATRAQRREAARLLPGILSGFKTKWDVEALTIDGVVVGDLFYDTFLMDRRHPTIDMESAEFREFLRGCLELFLFWRDYFDSHEIRAVSVSHCVYTLAIPVRLAAARGIPAYQANLTHVYRMSRENLFAYNDFMIYPERFRSLPEEVREVGLEEAERRISRRFNGEVGVDMAYSTKSAYSDTRHERLLRPSPRKKILIATHCFFDSPHSYGNNLFPDFYEWLDFLGGISEATDYDWYIKTHPDYLPGTMEIVRSFLAKYPKLTLLPADSSHHQIIAEGVDVALTVHGTIAFEYAALGVPVVNASLANPHIAYNFNINPRSLDEYRRILLDIEHLHLNIDKKSVYEYYFMKNIFNTNDLFFTDYKKMEREIGGYLKQFEPPIYDRWCEEWTSARHAEILDTLKTFVRSGDFRMDNRHCNRPFTVETIRGLS